MAAWLGGCRAHTGGNDECWHISAQDAATVTEEDREAVRDSPGARSKNESRAAARGKG